MSAAVQVVVPLPRLDGSEPPKLQKANAIEPQRRGEEAEIAEYVRVLRIRTLRVDAEIVAAGEFKSSPPTPRWLPCASSVRQQPFHGRGEKIQKQI